MPTLAEQAKELKRLSGDLTDFKTAVAKRTLQDSYRFAEIAEAEDFKINSANSDRVMVTGMLLFFLVKT